MAKLGILLLLMVCIHASLAGFGGRKPWKSGSRWVKSGLKKLGVESPWGSEGGESRPWTGKKNWRGEKTEEGRPDQSKMRDQEDMSDMMMMRMKRMFKPLRDLFVKVLDLGSKEPKVEGRPVFCDDNECPSFEVLNKSKHYEVRMYEPSQWVSTNMQAKKMSKMISTTSFWRLFKYIQGNNENEQKIKMTVPVTTVYQKIPTTEKMNFTMSFYLPPSITNPPTPNDNTVKIKREGSLKVYVHTFGGYAMNQKTWEKHARMLQRMLDRDGLSGKYYRHDEMYITAGYDDPMKLFNRHNEVWLVAKNQEA